MASREATTTLARSWRPRDYLHGFLIRLLGSDWQVKGEVAATCGVRRSSVELHEPRNPGEGATSTNMDFTILDRRRDSGS